MGETSGGKWNQLPCSESWRWSLNRIPECQAFPLTPGAHSLSKQSLCANLGIFFLWEKADRRKYYLPWDTWPRTAPSDLGCWAAGERCRGTAGWGTTSHANGWSDGKRQGHAWGQVKSWKQNSSSASTYNPDSSGQQNVSQYCGSGAVRESHTPVCIH